MAAGGCSASLRRFASNVCFFPVTQAASKGTVVHALNTSSFNAQPKIPAVGNTLERRENHVFIDDK
jgi:hypothetical protein